MASYTLSESYHRYKLLHDPSLSFESRRPRRSRVLLWCFCAAAFLFVAFRPISRASHTYRPDGLLIVNPSAPHPIPELISRAEAQWARKLAAQSRTFPEAVQEYRRRYGRAPPKGFEVWWDYAETHGVQLVDEYDSIHDRLEPFWGVDPRVLRAVQAEWEGHQDTFTIGKVDGEPLAVLNETMHGARMGHERAAQQLEMLEDVEVWLPDFRATFTMHDGPGQFTSWEMRKRAEEAAQRGEYIDVERVAKSINATGWAAACPPNSPIHAYTPPAPLTPVTPPTHKSFIHDHRLSMDPCLHPTHLTLSGYLSQYRLGPRPASRLAPTFSICTSPLHSDVLTIAAEQFAEGAALGRDPAWPEKVDERLLWRGSNTGILHQDGNAWNVSQRIRLVELGTRRGGTASVLGPGGKAEEVKVAALNAAFMDVGFVWKPIQCRKPVCETLGRMFEWRPMQKWEDAWQYKYLMDVDGNGWSARFKRLMTSRSLVFKSTIFPEWYTERIMPWVHYIPIQVDLSDVYDTLAFFRGDIAGAGAHDALAERIASQGREWSGAFYRREDMTAYHFRLFLEYARVMSEDREAMSWREGDGEGV